MEYFLIGNFFNFHLRLYICQNFKMKDKRLAILDLGTNTFHLLIAEIKGMDVRVLMKERFLVKLGKGGINNRKLLPDAINRGVRAIKDIRNILEKNQVEDTRCIATSAIRNATNRQLLLDKIQQQAGIKVEVIDGSTEAEYIYYGIRKYIRIGDKPTLMMDVGGGSVEFIIGNQHDILWKNSFEIGAQRLYDQFHQNDPVSLNDIGFLNEFLKQELQSLHNAVSRFKPKYMIGSSGTFDTINEIYYQKHHQVNGPITNGHPISNEELIEILDDIISKKKSDRKKIPGMSLMRVDMISMAAILVKYIVTTFQIRELIYSPSSLKEGFLEVVVNEKSVRELIA